MDAILAKCFEIFAAWSSGQLRISGPGTYLVLGLFELIKDHDRAQFDTAFRGAIYTSWVERDRQRSVADTPGHPAHCTCLHCILGEPRKKGSQ